ncbi:penicillin acylase family protein [Gynuella sp.]|uniref:penicillin acylase family protein n=1 Tax=Gynuella sp. TaxID=2969146 RepID=UPI003D1183C0
MIRLVRVFFYFFCLILMLVSALGVTTYINLQGSLPRLEGQLNDVPVRQSINISRDSNGVPLIEAGQRSDTAFAIGFLHAQERFFQMDLLRRNAAGELSELIGPSALERDKHNRKFQLRQRAENMVKAIPSDQRTLLQAYAEGVNYGLHNLKSRPFEYWLLRQKPLDWQVSDSLLCLLSMYLNLQQGDGGFERSMQVLKDSMPAAWYNFLQPRSGQWDAMITDPQPQNPLLIPDSDWPAFSSQQASIAAQPALGSNNWAIGGNLSTTGSAMVANDLHLTLGVPNIWYRASWLDIQLQRQLTGITLPGTPFMITGSNGHIAWGFTNAYGDWSDIITLQTNDSDTMYLTATGWESFTIDQEKIYINDGTSVLEPVRLTRWGPVIGQDNQGRPLAIKWVALEHDGTNANLVRLEAANTVDEALAYAPLIGIPHQNLAVADSQGNIGWTIAGRIPKRVGLDGEFPSDWSRGDKSWQGFLAPEQYPMVKRDRNGRIWTANSQVVSGDELKKIGNSGYDIGARAQQIRDDLEAKTEFSEADLLAIQLDDRAIFLQRWHELMIGLLDDPAVNHQSGVDSILKNWQGRASKNSVAYRLVRQFRNEVIDQTIGRLYQQIKEQSRFFSIPAVIEYVDYPAWALVSEQPEHLLPEGYDSWQVFLVTCLNNSIDDLTEDGKGPLKQQTWGKYNTLNLTHPLTRALPFLSSWLNMPQEPVDGDDYMPRVQGPAFGSSDRMVVSPGHEQSGIFNMPTSQAGHPMSPYYGKGHQDWVQGRASSFLPGPTQWTLEIRPEE